MRNQNSISFRWLGVAGLELGYPGQRIVFDPYFTRVSMLEMFFSQLRPNMNKIRRYLTACTRYLSPIPISTT